MGIGCGVLAAIALLEKWATGWQLLVAPLGCFLGNRMEWALALGSHVPAA
jgi:hypothetical protein